MAVYCTELCLQPAGVSYRHRGVLLEPQHTILDLQWEEGDVIEVEQESRYQQLSLTFESAVSIITSISESGSMQQPDVTKLSIVAKEYEDMAAEAPWDFENRDADTLLTAVHDFARSWLPIQLKDTLQSMSELDRKECGAFPSFLESVLKLLNIEGQDWPPLEPVSSDTAIQLAAAVSFSGRIAVLPESTDAALGMIAVGLIDSVDRAACVVDTIPQGLLQQLFQVAFLLCSRARSPPTSFLFNILQLFELWHFLRGQGCWGQQLEQILGQSQIAAVQTGRVLIERLSEDAVALPQRDVIHFFDTFLPIHLPHLQQPNNAVFMWALSRCAEKYPDASEVCIRLMQAQLSTSHSAQAQPGKHDVKALRSTFRYCLQHIQARLHKQQLPTTSQTHDAPHTVLQLLLSHGVLLSAKSPTLLGLISLPGFICGLEALARDSAWKNIPSDATCQQLGHLMAAYAAIWASLRNSGSGSSSSSSGRDTTDNLTITERLTLSLASTLHKHMLVLDVSHTDPQQAEDLAQWMAKIFDLTSEERGISSYHHQLHALVGTTLRHLVEMLLESTPIEDRAAIRALVPQLHSLPDIRTNPKSWSGHVEACASLFRGRHLMVSCGNVECTILFGPLDIALVTHLCSGCRRVNYCSVECQKADWAQWGHAGVCGKGSWIVSTAADVMAAGMRVAECAQRLGVATSARTETLQQLRVSEQEIHATQMLAEAAERTAIEAQAAAQAAERRATEARAAAAVARQIWGGASRAWAAAAVEVAVAGAEADVAEVDATVVRNAFNSAQ